MSKRHPDALLAKTMVIDIDGIVLNVPVFLALLLGQSHAVSGRLVDVLRCLDHNLAGHLTQALQRLMLTENTYTYQSVTIRDGDRGPVHM